MSRHDAHVPLPVPPDELLTPRLRLRVPRLDDAEAMFANWASDPQVSRFLPWAPHADVGVTREFLEKSLGERARGERFPFMLERRDDGRLLGMIDLRLVPRAADFGFVLERPSWGQGLMTEAATTVLAWCRSQPEIERVAAVCYVGNEASARVLERCGLRCEGLRRRGAVHGESRIDVLCFAWTRPGSAPSEPRALALDHVQLAMPRGGEDRARVFWRDLLGLRDVPRPAELAGRPWLWFERGAVRVHVGVEEDFRPARKAHPALAVSGYDALLARLAAAGHPARPAETLGGARRAHVEDPFGNRVELIDGEA